MVRGFGADTSFRELAAFCVFIALLSSQISACLLRVVHVLSDGGGKVRAVIYSQCAEKRMVGFWMIFSHYVVDF